MTDVGDYYKIMLVVADKYNDDAWFVYELVTEFSSIRRTAGINKKSHLHESRKDIIETVKFI